MDADIVILSTPPSDDNFLIVSPPRSRHVSHLDPFVPSRIPSRAAPLSASIPTPAVASSSTAHAPRRSATAAIELDSDSDGERPASVGQHRSRGVTEERSAADILAEMEDLAGRPRRREWSADEGVGRKGREGEGRPGKGKAMAKGTEGPKSNRKAGSPLSKGKEPAADAAKAKKARRSLDVDEDVSDDAAAPQPKKKRKADDLDKAAKAEEQRAAKARKEADKERENEEKRYAREAAKDKEAEKSRLRKLAEVNRVRTSKNDVLRDISVHLSPDLFEPSSPLSAALPEITTRLADNKCSIQALPPQPVEGVVKFLRRVRATWDAARRRFVPLADGDERDEWESHVVLVLRAEAIVDRILVGNDELGVWVRDVRDLLELAAETQVLLLITDMAKYHAKTKSLANKRFAEQARAGLGGPAKGKKSADAACRVSRETVEKELVRVQIDEKVFIVQVEKTENIEDWIYNLAGDIALKPHKLLRKSHLPFSAPDHTKKSSRPLDALEAMLQEVQGITASAAAGIAGGYGSFAALMRAYEREEARAAGRERAEAMLVDCEVRARVDGASSGRKLGKASCESRAQGKKTTWRARADTQAMSKRVYSVMRGTDPLALA